MRKSVVVVGSLALSAVGFGELAAAAPDPVAVQKIVDARVARYKQIGKANKAIKDELAQPQPNLANVQANARVIEAFAKQIPTWFPHGTGQQEGVNSEARPIIWEQIPTFKQRAAGLAGAAHQVAAVAGTGNLDATKAAAANIGLACKACHDTFREKK
jgi:cytochrome c556